MGDISPTAVLCSNGRPEPTSEPWRVETPATNVCHHLRVLYRASSTLIGRVAPLSDWDASGRPDWSIRCFSYNAVGALVSETMQ